MAEGNAVQADLIVSRNPAAPSLVVAEVPTLDATALDRRVEAATRSWPSWASDAPARAGALHRWADGVAADEIGLATLVADEVGKPIIEARAEVGRTVAILRYYAQAAFDPVAEELPAATPNTRLTVERRPVGVVAAVCPWNFPLAIPAWKIAPALAYGNAVLFKPSSEAVGVGQRLVSLARSELGEDVLAFLPMRGEDATPLFDDRRIGAVSFTGSSEIGHRVVARVAARGGAVQAEMGGQNASIVLDDADLDLAATTIAGASMGYAGQKCTATRRVIVTRSVATLLTEHLIDRVDALELGNPRTESTVIGPVIHARARDEVVSAIRGARSRGARILTGAGEVEADGWFVRPAVLQVDDPADVFVQEETFGPAVAIIVVGSDDQAVAVANSTRFGLAGAVFSTDIERGARLARRLEVGMVRVNSSTTGADFWAPFGGDGASSYGPREQGRASRDFFTRTRTVTVNG